MQNIVDGLAGRLLHLAALRERLCNPLVRFHLPQSAFVSWERTMQYRFSLNSRLSERSD
jgi:hypothetical protein